MADNNSCGCDEKFMEGMPLPEMSFQTFILSLSSSAMVHLGDTPNPETGTIEKAPYLAKHTIDILGMLQQKFKDGLEPEEEKMLCEILCSLRMKYINSTK
ncbi:MAG: DUF1844 domain-containing protein [Desulfovibrio sp.]